MRLKGAGNESNGLACRASSTFEIQGNAMGHHDLFFKRTFSVREHAVDFLRHVLPPALDEDIDYGSLAIEKGAHVDSNLAEYFSDTVYSCRFFGAPVKLAFLFASILPHTRTDS